MGSGDQEMDEGSGVKPTPHAAGDPNGRRLARRRAALLAEAGGVARLLDVLLKDVLFERADDPRLEVAQIVKDLGRLERTALQEAYGRVEPRTRFKKSASPAKVRQRNRSLLFIDESGQSGHSPLSGQPVFALAGIAMDEESVGDYRASADAIKVRFFGTDDITFHDPQMRKHDGPYAFGGDIETQRTFDAAIADLIERTPFTAFGTGVRKVRFFDDFVSTGVDRYLPTDVYAVAIVMMLERYLDYLSSRPVERLGRVTFESQGPREDAFHQLEYARALLDGSQWVTDSGFRDWLEPGLLFLPKSGSHPMELADMFARDLYEWVRGECSDDTRPWHWVRFAKKIHRRGDGRMGKFGVKVFPDHDIRDRIEAHRVWCGVTDTPKTGG